MNMIEIGNFSAMISTSVACSLQLLFSSHVNIFHNNYYKQKAIKNPLANVNIFQSPETLLQKQKQWFQWSAIDDH